MSLTDKQRAQILNIIHTSIEATEHFSNLIKKKELNQSVFIFSSIVDGFEAINNLLTHANIRIGMKEQKQIEQSLLLTAQQIEKENFTKIAAILQFSLMPQLRKWRQIFEAEKNIEANEHISIGVFLCQKDPRDAYPDERIQALIQESKRQHAHLIFFSSADVDFENEQIKASTYKNNQWENITTRFPDVIHNIGITTRKQQSVTERKLRRRIPFTSFGIGNKLHLPKKLLDHVDYADLLVPFKVATDPIIIHEFLQENTLVVFKPILGRQGENIYFVEQKGSRYTLLDHKKQHILGKGAFEEWLNEIILKNKGSYLIQKYIHARTKDKEPYDIRAHVQKDGNGKWTLTKIYPRIGNKKSILSNISRGGTTVDMHTFFSKEFGNKGAHYEAELENLSIELTQHLDKIHGFALDELGLDLAIDKNGRFWLHEVNNGPESTFHEHERAIQTIAYAIYIHKNGIVHTNEFQNSSNKNHFQVRTSNLPVAEIHKQHLLGMLVHKNEIDALTVACAYVAAYEHVDFYYFTPEDIDYDEMLIQGYFYENNEWVPKIVRYPDAIYDRLRLKGIKGYQTVYEELAGIPFTNEFHGNSISKLEVYDALQESGELQDIIIPYQKASRVKDILLKLDHYEKIILKPSVGSFARGVHYMEKRSHDHYFIAEGKNEETYNASSLKHYLRELLKKETFIIQKYINTKTIDGHPFDIRVHMMKDQHGEWSYVQMYPRIGMHHAVIMITKKGGYIGKLTGFLTRNFGAEHADTIEQHIKEFSLKTAQVFESLRSESVSEVALDFALNKDKNLHLIEVNVNKPGIVYYEFQVAQHAISYAIHLSSQHAVT